MFYTYAHYLADSGKVFYVGKGSRNRAWQGSRQRSKWWQRVVEKHGYTVEVLSHWESESDAFEHEKLLIASFRELGHPLVNMTGGGQGSIGPRHTESFKESVRARMKAQVPRKLSEETKEKIRAFMRGKPGPRNCERLSAEEIARRSATRRATAPKFMSADGSQRTAAEWANHLDLHISTIHYRIKTGKLVPAGRS